MLYKDSITEACTLAQGHLHCVTGSEMKGHVTALANLANDISLLPPFYIFLLPSKSGSQNPQVEESHRQAFSLLLECPWANEMARCATSFAFEPDILSRSPGTPWWKERTNFQSCLLTATRMLWHTYLLTSPYNN